MTEWWDRPAPSEGWEFQIDPDTGRGDWHYREHLWLSPFRGLAELVSDICNGRMRTRDWVFIGILLVIITRA
ncbi:MAG: hypothetical protein ACRDLO_15935 [Solirubrobacterales bacterium]